MLSLALALAINTGPAPITVGSLLSEMASRDRLASLPAFPFKQLQASSYDRTQTDPNDPKTWHNNADYGQFIRTEKHGERTEWVIMEHQGPGAITRIWTPLLADKKKMVVRFYFNGSADPGIEENFNDFVAGRGRIKPPLAFVSWPDPGVKDGVGADMYFPIPFRRSCKVTLSEVPFYYSVDYRSYPTNTPVETFSWSKVGQPRKLGFSQESGSEKIRATMLLDSETSLKLTLSKASHAISDLEVDVPKDIDPQALRSTVVEIVFDGERTVWCPIGDFFGCGTRLRPVTDRYRRVESTGTLSCDWTMPYRHSATVSVLNLGKRSVPITVKVATKPWTWTPRSMHFHATWRHQYPLATRPMSDWNYLEASGQGVYVGDTLTVMSPSPAWYGEGDERVYVDGEKFPSQLGTGTEDYYGYAWGMAEHFSSPFMAMPARDLKGRDNWMGFTTTSRVRGLDEIPFNRSFRFDMEIWHWAECQVDYAATSFWYARPGATSNRLPAPQEAARPLPEAEGKIHGAIEAETLEVVRKAPGVVVNTQTGGLTQGSWSSGGQLFIQAHQVGDFAELKVPVTRTGKYRLLVYATKSFDYGIVRFGVDGKPLAEIDLWSEKPVTSGPIDLGVVELMGKEAVLRLELIGTNARSINARFFAGVDCVVLKPVAMERTRR